MPEPTSEERASYVGVPIDQYASASGRLRDVRQGPKAELVLADFLADIRHWAKRERVNYARAAALARVTYRTETTM